MDTSKRGALGQDYLKARIRNDAEVIKRLEILDIRLTETEVAELFDCVMEGVNETHPITLQEFVVGFARLRGHARAKDVVKLHGDLATVAQHVHSLESKFDSKYANLE